MVPSNYTPSTFFLVLLTACCTNAHHLVNFTIDDTYGDISSGDLPLYAPDLKWKSEKSSKLPASPDPYFAHAGTWSWTATGSGKPPYSLEIKFDGVAVYVYFILSKAVTTACDFYMDGVLVDSFLGGGDQKSGDPFIYDTLGFSRNGLEARSHNLAILSKPHRTENNVLYFDYAIYTTDVDIIDGKDESGTTQTPPPLATSSPGVGPPAIPRTLSQPAFIGIIVGVAVVVIALLGISFFFWRRRSPLIHQRVTSWASTSTFPPANWISHRLSTSDAARKSSAFDVPSPNSFIALDGFHETPRSPSWRTPSWFRKPLGADDDDRRTFVDGSDMWHEDGAGDDEGALGENNAQQCTAEGDSRPMHPEEQSLLLPGDLPRSRTPSIRISIPGDTPVRF